MDLDLLYRFHCLGKNRSMTKAAEECFISKQAFARSMDELEKTVDLSLLQRSKAGIQLTEAGQKFWTFLDSWLLQYEQATNSIRAEELGKVKEIRIGCSYSDPPLFLMDLIFSFQKQYPGIKIHFEEYSISEALRLLEKKELDIVYSISCSAFNRFNSTVITEAENYILVHRDNPLYKKDILTIPDLKGMNMVIAGKNKEPNEYLEEYASTLNAIPLYTDPHNLSYSLPLMKSHNAFGLIGTKESTMLREMGFRSILLKEAPFDLSSRFYYHTRPSAAVMNLIKFVKNREQ